MKESTHKRLVTNLRKAIAFIIKAESLLNDACDGHKALPKAKAKAKRKAKAKAKK